MGRPKGAPQRREPEEEPGVSGGSEEDGAMAAASGSDEGNDYGMGSDDSGDGEGGSGGSEEEEEEEEEGDEDGDGGPGILGLAGSSDGEEEGEDGDGDDGDEEQEEEEEEEERDAGSSDADDEGGSDGEDGAAARRARHASFLSGEKGASFAKAFAKIIQKPGKAAAAAKAATDVILSASAGVQKRKQEEEEGAAARQEAKKQRLALKTRGHVTVPRKGEDPSHDVREKQLQRLATRGVVLLFNAVNKAQRQKAEAEAAGGVSKRKAAVAKLGKASFLAELKQASTKGIPVDGAAGGAAAQGQQQRDGGGGGGASWAVLGEGFPGLTRGAKMKDWDRQAGSDEDAPEEQPHLAGADISSDEADGW